MKSVRTPLYATPLVLRLPLLAILAVGARAAPVQGQVADALAGHFGATRTRHPGKLWSLSAGAMLLTEYGSRWQDEPLEIFTEYDPLDTTVGYNYFSGGLQWSWLAPGPGGEFILAGALTAGRTSDRLTEAAQDGLHNYRRYPHVFRGHVSNGFDLQGGEVEAAYWLSGTLWGMRLEGYPVVGGIWSSYHREASIGAGGGVGIWKLKLQGSLSKGWLFGRGSIVPSLVGQNMDSDYTKRQLVLGFDADRFGSLVRLIPSLGIGVTWSSGIFIGEPETLLSLYFEFPSPFSTHYFRVETVNDLLAGKDRGPTGGLRLTYVARLP